MHTSMCDKNSWLYRYPCSIHGRSGAFRDGYNLNHLNGLLNSIAICEMTIAIVSNLVDRDPLI